MNTQIEHIVVTGYSGTGSSAAVDLLKEFSNCAFTFNKKSFEDFFLTAPGALFDLEWKLLNANDPHRSDEAICNFKKTMKWLYESDFLWSAGYKNNIGEPFIKNVESFINEIASDDGLIWYYRERTRKSHLTYFIRFLAHTFVRKTVAVHPNYKIVDKSPVYFSIPSEDEFFAAAVEYLQCYINMISFSDKVTIHDHLIWPMQIEKIDKYFDDSFRFIILQRDPRDMFLLNKYFWASKGDATNLPLYAEKFCEHWRRLMSLPKVKTHPQVITINFEDLIYHYDETTQNIISFCGLDKASWLKQRQLFDPARSIKNTQSFLLNDEMKKEGALIKKLIPEYCYDFPYESNTSIAEMFL